MQIIYDKDSVFQYSYLAERDYSKLNNSFLSNTLKALDFLYKNDVLTVYYSKDFKVDIIDALVDDADEEIRIIQGPSNKYYPATNTIQFKDTHGVEFRKNFRKRFSGSNIGYNSPVALLSHELIHCYHELFDENGYKKRRQDHTTKGHKLLPTGVDLSFPNREEALVVRLTNQVAKRLGEDKRGNYGRNYYPTKDVLSTEKLDENEVV
jgi:hypothetical protein